MSEALDANKTGLTHTATAAASAWLARIGCKPIETEVEIADGWIADLAAAWIPTVTEAKVAKLITKATGDTMWDKDREALARIYRQLGGICTVAIEVKTSRSDLMKDAGRKYTFNGKTANATMPAHYCVLACPASIAPDRSFDPRWSVLRLSEDCTRGVKSDLQWYANPLHASSIQSFLYNVAVRCEHRTRYARQRAWLKSYRAAANKQRSVFEGAQP